MTAQDLLQKLFRGGNDYRLTRFVILRLLGFVYAVAFLVAAQQLVPLVGEHGLTPARNFLVAIESQLGSRGAGAMQMPTLFWFGISDQALSISAWIGFALSLVVLSGYANALILAVLWIIYMSLVHVGQIWYGYGWETQLLETGFLSIFLCPLLDLRPFPKRPPPLLVIWLFRWLGFRIMIGAGLIKLRGDACWRDLTCLYYHYETQPIPNAISRYLHFAPHWFHKFGTAWNHFIELVVPSFSFGPRHVRHIAGLLLVSFQVVLIVSGNLSFLNYVTIIPFLAC
ncbi:MAG: membrane protein, partial [Verrucomicrobia bacterium]